MAKALQHAQAAQLTGLQISRTGGDRALFTRLDANPYVNGRGRVSIRGGSNVGGRPPRSADPEAPNL
jgi:hypothetical protein